MKLLAVLLFVALPALAEEEKLLDIPGLRCSPLGVCIIPLEVLNVMIETHNALIDENRALKKKPPKCAELEVTEPSKAPKPPIKRENDL